MNFKNSSLKEEAAKLMQLEGNVRGEVFLDNAAYIKYREGEEGLILVEEKLAELGYPLKFTAFTSLKWYPESLSVLVILVAKEIFNWSEDDLFEMGNSVPKFSFIVKMLMGHFISPKKCFEESPKYWKSHFDFGELEAAEFNEKEKYLKVRVKGYKFHPFICACHAGYFLRIAQFVLQGEKITIKETKCIHKGDPYHEYLISWQ